MDNDLNENIAWTKRLEVYFTDIGEKATCLAWSHKRAEELYAKRRTYIDLPVIILSSVTGFLSVGTSSIFGPYDNYAPVGLGVLSLFVGILNTTGSYFGWTKRAEAHRISSIHYSKLYRFIAMEMALPRDQRMSPKDLLKYARDQYERLTEISPLIPHLVIEAFKKKFSKVSEITFPEELNGLEPITVYNEYDDDLRDYFKLASLPPVPEGAMAPSLRTATRDPIPNPFTDPKLVKGRRSSLVQDISRKGAFGAVKDKSAARMSEAAVPAPAPAAETETVALTIEKPVKEPSPETPDVGAVIQSPAAVESDDA